MKALYNGLLVLIKGGKNKHCYKTNRVQLTLTKCRESVKICKRMLLFQDLQRKHLHEVQELA